MADEFRSDGTAADDEPEVYAVEITDDGYRFPRRSFLELASMVTVTAAAAACGDAASSPSGSSAPAGATTSNATPTDRATVNPTPGDTSTESASTTTTSTTESSTPPTPQPGPVPSGTNGAQYEVGGEAFNLPCGSPIPAGATCSCNCVSVPACSCVSDTGCTCDSDVSGGGGVSESHYWYPN